MYRLTILLSATLCLALPAPSADASPATNAYTSSDPNLPLWNANSGSKPEPIRGSLGASVIGPQNIEVDLENPDLLAPPGTDNGEVCVLSSSLALLSN